MERKMKNRTVILIASIGLILIYSTSSYSSGVIEHVAQAQAIIDKAKTPDSGIPPEIASIITKSPETEKAFRSGALDGDIFNPLIYPEYFGPLSSLSALDPYDLVGKTHRRCSASIASFLLKNAKTDVEKAYAYGWLSHLAGDVIGHPLTNRYVGNGGQDGDNPPVEWDPTETSFGEINRLHQKVEEEFDNHALGKFGFDEIHEAGGMKYYKPRLSVDIDIPVNFLKNSIGDAFGETGKPGPLRLEIAENLMQGFLNYRADKLANKYIPDDPVFDVNYNAGLDAIINWLKDPATYMNQNFNLDNGRPQSSEDCLKAKIPQKPSPGNDHSDDNVSAATLQAAGEVPFEDWLRVAIKRDKKGALFLWRLRNKLNEFESLPENTDIILKEQKRRELIYFYTSNINNPDSLEGFREGNQAFVEDIATAEDVGILDNGFSQEMATLIAKTKESTVTISPEALTSATRDKKIIVVPSGGLYGMEKSEFLKASLDEYVKNGGTLIVFGQQHGYEFSVLPVPQEADGTYKTVGGYGWSEDQSCQYSSSFIETWHQFLSGQSRATPNINVDGYFTTYPSNATVILRRTSNGQPDLLMYEYGQGMVIVSSMYTDYALSQNHASSEEVALIRDMVSWAKKPDQLPEIKPGQSVTVPVLVTNNTTSDASSLKILVYNPDRTTLLSERSVSAPVPAGQSTTIPVTYATTTGSALGIYHIDYVLYDSSGTIIQPQAETDSGRFAVSNPPANPYKPKDLLYAVNVSRGYFLSGESIPITVTIWNNSNSDKKLRYYWDYTHSIATFLEEVQVPAHGSISRNYTLPQISGTVMLWVHFFEENGTPVSYQTIVNAPGESWPYVGSGGMTIPVLHPYASATVRTDKAFYARGETVSISVSLQNQIILGWQPNVQIAVYDFWRNKIYGETKTIALPPSGNASLSVSFALPSSPMIGSYWVNIYVPSGASWYSASAYASFEVAESQILLSPNVSSIFSVGTNTIPFTISNIGKVNVSSGTLDLSLKGPDGSIVYSASQPISIAMGESKTLDVPISIPSLKLGNYTLTYSESDETRTGKPVSVALSNSCTLSPALDKASYKIGETANAAISITNTGKFLQEASLAIDVPFLGLSDTKSVTVNPSETKTIPYSLVLPLTLKQGGPGKVTLTFPSGDRIERGINIAIKPVGIKQDIVFDKPSYRIRENLGINYNITNDGNFVSPINGSFNLSIPDMNYAYQGNLVLEPMKDVAVPLTIPIPENILAGWHDVKVDLILPWDTVTAETGFVVPESRLIISYSGTTTPRAGDTISLSIENTGGVDTTYTTQKLSINDSHGVEIYSGSAAAAILTGEKKPLVDIQIPAQALNGPAYLNVQLRDGKTEKTVYYDKPIEIRGLTASLQTRSDKDVYLSTEAVTGISSILNGPYGIEEGNMKVSVNKISQAATGQFTHFLPKQEKVSFSYPSGVAVGPDRSIYVADTDNNRIQKFDSNGNFIKKWGSYCNVDSDGDGIADQPCNGQLNYPYSIATGPDGSVYVADSGNHRVQKFDSGGNFITKWGSYCTTDTNGDGVPDQACDGQFNYAEAVAVGPDGSVYVADDNYRIQKFDSDGNFMTKWGSYCNTDSNGDSIPDQACDGQFNYIYGIAVGPEGSVFVTDTGNHRIQKFDNNGNFVMKWGSQCISDANGDGVPEQPCDGQFNYPWSIAIGPDGFVYVTDSENNRIQKFDYNGNFITKWGNYCYIDSDGDGVPDQSCNGQFEWPAGIAVGLDGFVYVSDAGNNRVQKFDTTGAYITKWGSESTGSGDGEFNTPFGVAVGYDGSIYISDSGNHRVQKFDNNGNFITKWGTLGSGDGQFDWPAGITSGPDGSLYVADTYNNRIQKFDSNGNLISKWVSFGIEQGFNGPLGVAVGPDGSVYVADTDNSRIEKFDSNGNLIIEWKISGGMCGEVNCRPTGIAVGPDGSVYVADPVNSRIQKFDSNGTFITSWESYVAACGEGCPPTGIAVGPDGFTYVAARGNQLQLAAASSSETDPADYSIQKFDSNGNFIAGYGSYGSGDGQFINPGGIAVAPDGSIYVADMGNHRIQRTITVSLEYITETLFETTLPINQPASAIQDYTTNIGALGVTGKLLLQAKLKNNLSQTIAQASYPFYIVEGNTVLLFNTDKKIYKLGETVTITGQVQNLATIEAAGLTLALNSKLNTQTPELLLTEGFNIPAGGIHPFTITATAGVEGVVTLTGEVTQDNSTLVEITDQYEVAKPNVSVSVSAPDIAGSQPFAISVEMKNTGKVDALVQFAIQSSEFGDSQTLTIPSGDMRLLQYSQQITKDTSYTFTFTGDLEQTLQKAVSFGEKADVQLTLQPSYKEGDILLTYLIRNTGMLEAAYPVTFTLFSNGQEISRTTRTFTLPVNGSLLDSLKYSLSEGSYVLRYETSGFQTESQINVAEAAQGEITMAVNDFYPEGAIILRYTFKNIGPFDAEFAFEFELGTTLISKTAFIPAGGEYSDDLRLNLLSGNYTIKATLVSQPSTPFTKSFQVVRENDIQMAAVLGAQTNGLVPVNVNLTNSGFNEINGSVNLSVTAGSGQVVWSGEETLSQLSSQNSQALTLNINPSGIEPGNYNVQVTLLNNGNQPITSQSLPFGIQSATFQITQLPPYQTFPAGQEATFVFRVRNIGGQEGSFDLKFKTYDLIDSTQREWIKPGEEKTISFAFVLPEDLEEKDYFADYELKGSAVAGQSKGQIKYHLTGISLNVNASLDKPYYNEGETAHLTINIQSPNPNPQDLFARLNYAGFEPQQTFTLTGSQVLIFDVPLSKITGEKLFYGIYHESGRSVHLNSLYIHKAGEVLTIETDKQVYQPRDVVSVSVSGNTSGNMTLTGPGGYSETFGFSGLITKTFNLPSSITAGTYFINVQLTTQDSSLVTAVHPFDVAGIQVKVLECNNDKGKYASSDTITTNFTISSNTGMPAILKAWIVDPTGQYATVGEQSISLASPDNSLVTQVSPLSTSVSGIHRLVYGIYGPEDLLLCSGSEAFDVGDAVLMGLSTDKRDYPSNTEPVTVIASLYGSVSADLQLELDGTVVKSETISLNGFTPYTTQLPNIIPGPHTLKATLTAGGLKSTKETSFTYALAYMPKPQISASPSYVDFGSVNLGSTSTQTVELSSTGNVDLVIGTIILSGTNQGEFSLQNDNCSSRTISPSGNCTLGILFSPTSLDAKSASLSISSNVIDTPRLYLSLAGAGTTTLNISINPDGGGKVAGTGIDCPGDCTEAFSTTGASIQLTAIPTEGYRFVNWTGDTNSPDNPITIMMDTHKNVTANFAINAYTINVAVGLGGNITPTGSIPVNPGASQTFIITPNVGYHVADVRIDGISVGPVTTYTFSNVTSAHTIEATFAINQYTFIATAGPNGTIVPSGAVTVDHGGNLSFTITPNPGYRVSDVKVDGGSIGLVATYTFTNVTAAHTIEASFVINQHTITVAAGSNGTITPSGTVTVDHGGSQTFAITPNTGYRISDVDVDGVMLGVTRSYTFSNVTSDHTISATFKQIQIISLPFTDNFEDDPAGTGPNLPWDNFNGGPAMVTGSSSHSPANSISVSSGPEGSGSSFVNLGDTYPERIAYEVWAKANSSASSVYIGFSEEILGILPQFNAVYFNGADGKVYFMSADKDHGFMVPLLESFTTGVWHKVHVEIDFANLLGDVYIDDVLVGKDLPVSPKNATWEQDGTHTFQLNKIGVTHHLGDPFSFDDFTVSEWNPNTPVNLLRSAGPGQWAVLGMGGIGSTSSTSISMSGSSSVKGTIANTGVANAGSVNMSGSSLINGILSLNTAGHLNKSGTSTIVGGIQQNTSTDAVLDQAVADALAASQSAAALPATITSPTSITISNLSQNITITGGTGANILNITNIAISNGTLTLSAPHGGWFIMNVSGSFALSGASRIVLAGGITSSDVLYNFAGGKGNVSMSGGSSVAGILLAPQRAISLSNSTVTGEIISGGSAIAFSGTTQVNNPGP
jgi:tripartite motif-containing protein 71